MNYIYRFRVKRGEVVKDFALPTWNESLSKRIEKATHHYFDRHRVDYHPRLKKGLLDQVIKVGISNNPGRRLSQCNDDWTSGKTEYFKVGPFTSLGVTGFLFIYWLWFTVVRPLLAVSLIVLVTLLAAS